MRYYLLLLFLFISIATIGQTGRGAQVSETKLAQPQNTFALIVGVSKYKHSSTYPSLKYADDDARAFYNFLRSPDGGAIPEENLDSLIDEDATFTAFWESLFSLDEELNTGDRLYIYFAGHGDAFRADKAFLLPHDAPNGKGKGDKNHYLMGTGVIDVGNLKIKLSQMINDKDIEVILITDACRSGETPGGDEGKKNMYNAIFETSYGEVQLMSCSGDQLSYEGEMWGNGRGLFSYHLINGMRGFADIAPQDGKVTLVELTDYTKRKVQLDKYDEELSIYLQTPQYCCSKKDGMVFTRSNSEEGFAALLELKPKNNAIDVEQLYASRDVDGTSKYSMSKSENLEKMMIEAGFKREWKMYQEASEEGRLLGEKSALEVLNLLKEKGISPKLQRLLKYNYAGKLMNDVSKVLNTYIEASLNNKEYSSDYFQTAYLKLEQYRKTTKSFYYDEDNVNANLFFLRAHALMFKHRTYEQREALRMIDSAIVLKPEAAYLFNLKGLLQNSLGHYNKAIKTFNQGINLAPNWVYPTHNLGMTYLNQEAYDSAYKYLTKSLNLDTNYSTAYLSLSKLKAAQGDLDSAKVYSLKGLKKDYDDLWIWNQLGNIYLEKHDFSDAQHCFHRALARDTSEYFTYRNLINLHIQNFNIGDSVPYYINKMVQTDTTNPLVYYALANTLKMGDLTQMAANYYNKAVSLDTLNAKIWESLGMVNADLGYTDSAIENLKITTELEDENHGAFFYISQLYAKKENWEAAILYAENALSKSPENYDYLYTLGNYNLSSGKYKDAITAFEKLQNIYSNYKGVHYKLACAYAAQNKGKKAIKQLQEAVRGNIDVTYTIVLNEPHFNSVKRKKEFKEILNGLESN